MKAIDDEILNASPKELKNIQKLDRQTQLNGSFYDVYYALKHPKQSLSQRTSRTKNTR